MLIGKKYELTVSRMAPDIKSVLDVGCRDGIMKKYLPPSMTYTGFDIIPGPAVDRVGSLEKGLPFKDGEFDAVIALDVLEHTDDIWFSFDELARVARRQVIVLMPNVYHWLHRFYIMRGKEFDKYRLTADKTVDRHRWLTTYESASNFFTKKAAKSGMATEEHILFGGPKLELLDEKLAKISKNLAAWAVMHVMTK